MDINPSIKLKIVLGLMFFVVAFVVALPFIIVSGFLGLSEAGAEALFYAIAFLAVLLSWGEFNKLRLTINKKELEDADLIELEHDVEKLASFDLSNKSKQ